LKPVVARLVSNPVLSGILVFYRGLLRKTGGKMILSEEKIMAAAGAITSRHGACAKVYINDLSARLGSTPEVVSEALSRFGIGVSSGKDAAGDFIRMSSNLAPMAH
jgi:hypothetical protein